MDKIKHFIRDHEGFMAFISFIYRALMLNRVKGRKNLKISWAGGFAKRTHILNYGSNNILELGKGCRMSNCKIQFFGNGNKVRIASDCVCRDVDIWVSDGGEINIEHNTHFTGKIHIASIEGTKVSIGSRCLFSNEITLRTGDSHSILNMGGQRINPSKDIIIGDHVWVGQQVVILKGANIGAESIIGTRALVTGKQFEEGVIIAGSPAKVIKENVTWHHELK